MKGRPDREIALEVLERLLDCHQQQIMAPQLGRVFLDEIGAQQIAACVSVWQIRCLIATLLIMKILLHGFSEGETQPAYLIRKGNYLSN